RAHGLRVHSPAAHAPDGSLAAGLSPGRRDVGDQVPAGTTPVVLAPAQRPQHLIHKRGGGLLELGGVHVAITPTGGRAPPRPRPGVPRAAPTRSPPKIRHPYARASA